MADAFDELQIIIEAEARAAEKEIDNLIDKITKSQQALMNTEKTASGFGDAFSKSMAKVDMGDVKKGTREAETYVKNTAKQLAKDLILQFKIENTGAQDTVRSLTEDIARMNWEYGKSEKLTGKAGDFFNIQNKLTEHLAEIITMTHNARQEVASEISGIYDEILHSGKIRIPANALKEIEWGSLDGLLKQHLNSHVGTPIETFIEEVKGRFGDIFETFAKASNLDMSRPQDQMHVLIGLLQQFRNEAEQSPLFSKEAVNDGVWNVVHDRMESVKSTAQNSFYDITEKFQKFDTEVANAKAGLQGLYSAYSEQHKFSTVEGITKEIQRLEDKLYNVRQESQMKVAEGKGWNSLVQDAAKYESQIESLKARLATMQIVPSDSSVLLQSCLDAIDRICAEEEKLANETEKVEEDIVSLANETAKIGADTNVATVSDSLVNVGNAAHDAETKYSTLGATIEFIKRTIQESPANLFEKLDFTRPKQEFVELSDNIEQTQTKLDKLKAQMERGLETGKNFKSSTTFRKLSYDIEEAENSLKAFQADMDELGYHTHEINWDGIGRQGQEAFGIVKNAVHRLITAIGSLATSLGSRITNGFKNVIKNANSLDAVAKKLSKSFLRVSNMLRLMVTRMALRGVINEAKAGFKDLIAFSDKTADSYNKIRNAIRYLADSLAAMISPLMNASATFGGLGNIIDMLADKVVDLVNKINQLMAALLGHSTWIKATKQATNYAEAATNAGKAAKGALQGFDELNNLSSNQGGSGSGGSGAGGAQYQELPIEQKWTDIAEWLKEQWEKGDFTELGAVIGGKLKDALDNIPWDDIKKACYKIGTSIGTFINGFVEVPGLADTIGRTVGEAINSGVLLIKGFVDVTHFDSIGTFIGKSIVSAVETIDWETLKGTAADLGKKLAEGINAFFDTNVMDAIGKAVGETLTAAINLWYKFVGTLDFSMIGEKIKSGLNTFLDTMSEKDLEGLNGWQKLGSAISNTITGALKTANIVLGDDEARAKVTQAVTDFLDSISWEDIYNGVKELAGNVVKALLAVIKGAFASDEFRNFAIEFTIDAGNIALAVTGGVMLANAAKTAIAGAIGTPAVAAQVALALTVGTVSWKFGNWLNKTLTGSDLNMTIGQQVAYILGTDLGEAKFAIKMMFSDDSAPELQTLTKVLSGGVATLTMDIINGKSVSTVLTDMQKIVEFAKNPVNFTVNLLGNGVLDDAKDKILKIVGYNGTTADLKVTIAQSIIDTLEKVYNFIKGIKDILTKPFEFAVNFGSDLKDNVSESGVLGGFKKTVSEIFSKNGQTATINATVNETGTTKPTSFLSSVWSKITSSTETKKTEVKEEGSGNNKPSSFLTNIWSKITGQDKTATLTVNQKGAKAEDIAAAGQAIKSFPKGKKAKKSATLEIFQTVKQNGENSTVKKLLSGADGLGKLNEEWKKMPTSARVELIASAEWKANTKEGLEKTLNDAGIKVDVAAQIKSVQYAASQQHMNANGGFWTLGQWHNIGQFAAGGIPNQGQMFIAREDGPELVGQINGGGTAVMNNDQIVASVSDGVYKAVVAAMSGMQNNTVVTLEGDAGKLFKAVQKYGNDYQRRTGNPVFA